MNKPALTKLTQSFLETFKRFPLVVINSMIGIGAIVYLIEIHDSNKVVNLVFACLIGLPLLTGLALVTETKKKLGIALQAVGILFLLTYFITLPVDRNGELLLFTRFFILNAAFHLFVAFSFSTSSAQLFWQFNQKLFTRLLESLFFSLILGIGLSVALAAIHSLFNIRFDDAYIYIWTLSLGFVNTIYFLSGIPTKGDQIVESYPKPLRVFLQFIFTPLIIVYFVILYAYGIKILVTGIWPKGIISYLVAGFSCAGILNYLLLHPLKDDPTQSWAKIYHRYFFPVVIPVLSLLFVAIGMRISDYGITENRYLILLAGIWLAFISLAQIITRGTTTKIVPVSLCLLLMVSAYGPLSAFNISFKSQMGIFTNILEKNGMLVEGKIQPWKTPLSKSDIAKLNSVGNYLDNTHGFEVFKKYFTEDIKIDSAQKLMAALNIDYTNKWSRNAGSRFYFSSTHSNNDIEKISGFDYLIHINSRYAATDNSERFYPKADHTIIVIHDKQNQQIKINETSVSYKELLAALIKNYKGKRYNYNIDQSEMTVVSSDGKLKLVFLTFDGDEDNLSSLSYEATVFYTQ